MTGYTFHSTILLVLLALLLGACAATRISGPVALISAGPDAAIEEHLLLDIAIDIFAPLAELPSAGVEGLQSLRTAEGHYLSWQLAQALRDSGHWGTIQLNPFTLDAADLHVAGTVLQSDGETLRVHVSATDATGRPWLDREYLQLVAGDSSSGTPGATPPFPFQSLLYRISNDILAFRESRLTLTDIENLRKVSALGFAADFAPALYGDYLGSDRSGRSVLERLPPLDDQVYAEIATIRARNMLFLDALQAQYAVYVAQVDEPYRRFLARSQVITGILNGRVNAEENEAQYGAGIDIGLGMDSRTKNASRFTNTNQRSDTLNSGRYASIYSAALAEAGATFDMVVQPQTLEFSARTVDLSGSLAEQFTQWREVLGEIHALDTAR